MKSHSKIRGIMVVVSIVAFPALVSLLGGCGTSATRGSSGGDSTSNNELATAYPADLAVTSPTASSSSSSALRSALVVSSGKSETTFTPQNFEAKKEDLQDLINFDDQDTFEEVLGGLENKINIFLQPAEAACYGPSLYYVNHPDASAGEIDANNDDGPNDDDGQLPGMDLGIWSATESATGEACCVAQMNNIVANFEALVNAAAETIAAGLGAASLDDTLDQLPDAGESLDLAAKANSVLTENNVPVEFDSAVLSRDTEDSSDGDPVFVTDTDTTLSLPEGTATMEATLTHIPMGEETSALKSQTTISNETYCGTLVQAVNITVADAQELGNCVGSDGLTRCALIDYCKTASTSITYHLRTAEFCGQNKDCGTVDPADKVSGSNPDGWGNGFYYTVCQINPEDGTGSCAQAWQAGMGDGNTRVLNVVVNADDTGRCYVGFGPDVAAASGVGSIDRMICNWAGPGSSHTGVSLAQRQEFDRNDDGIFVPTSSNILYAPTNSCNKSAGNFAYGLQSPPTDVPAGNAVTNNLVNLADVDFTMPSLPAVP